MNIEKLSPTNWFRKEDEHHRHSTLTPLSDTERAFPLSRFHHEIDQMFEEMLRNFGRSHWLESDALPTKQMVFKPSLDIREDADKYCISIEIPGIAPIC